MKQPSSNQGFFSNLSADFPAGVVVFLVALPLCLGIALASGAPLFSGIIAGIIGGTLVALVSGSPLGVSGPAAGLAVIVLNAIDELGSYEVFLVSVVLAGIIQLLLGFLKAGVIGYYFPSAVIKGMLSGIGIIILLKQIPHALGDDKDYEGDEAFFQSDGENTFSEIALAFQNIDNGAVIIFGVALFILVFWDLPFMKKQAWTKIIPGPLVAVTAGIGLNLLFREMQSLSLGAEHLVSVPEPDSVKSFFSQFTFPDFSGLKNTDVYITAGTMAVIASLETLLCVEATDKLDPQKRVTPTNRELLAQGTGNIASSLIGGLPITQVIVRSSANIQSGGKTKAAAFIHGILLLVCAMTIPGALNLIPLSCLAAILILVGYKLAKPSVFSNLYRKGWDQFIPFLITILGIVFTDLLIGIAMGMSVAFVQILWNNFKTPYHYNPNQAHSGKPICIRLSEDVSFLNKASILNTLNLLPDGSDVVIDASKVRNIHPDVIEVLEDFTLNAPTRNIRFELIGMDLNKDKNPVQTFGRSMRNTNGGKQTLPS